MHILLVLTLFMGKQNIASMSVADIQGDYKQRGLPTENSILTLSTSQQM